MTREQAVTATMEAIAKWDPAWAAQDWSRLSKMELLTLSDIGDCLMRGDIHTAFDKLKLAHKAWTFKRIMQGKET